MSLLDYLFDTHFTLRDDIDQVGKRADFLTSDVSGIDGQVQHLSAVIGQLSATVRVLVRKLAETGQLDLATLADEVKAEIKRPTSLTGERLKGACVRCGAQAFSDELVKVGADLWCRPCARNP